MRKQPIILAAFLLSFLIVLSATAQAVTYQLTAEVNPTGSGSLYFHPYHPGNIYSDGEAVWITSAPNAGYKFGNWSGDASGISNPVAIIMDDDKYVVANNITGNLLTVNSNIPGAGTVSLSPANDYNIYDAGEQVWMTATPNEGWIFMNWSDDVIGKDNPTSVIMDSNKMVMADFAENTKGWGGFPQLLYQKWKYSVNGAWVGAAGNIVYDIDGDGEPEIVITGSAHGGYYPNDIWYVLKYDGMGGYRQIWSSAKYSSYIEHINVNDTDNDGIAEIYIGLTNGQIRVYDGRSFEELGLFKVDGVLKEVADTNDDGDYEIITSDGTGISIYNARTFGLEWQSPCYGGSVILVGNVDADDALEIVCTTSNSVHGYVIDGITHNLEWDYPTGFGGAWVETVLGDIDGDGMEEIIGYKGSYSISIFDADAKKLSWEIDTQGNVNALDVADTDGNGVPELLYGDSLGGGIHCINGITRSQIWLIPNPVSGITHIAVADVDMDGDLELLWGGGSTENGAHYLLIVGVSSKIVEWQSVDIAGSLSAVDVGDVDDDGQDEIIMVSFKSYGGTFGGSNDGVIHIFDAATHELEWRSEVLYPTNDKGVRSVRIADVDGDGNSEFAVTTASGYNGSIYVYDGRSHEIKYKTSKYDYNFFTVLRTDDIDGDGNIEIVAGQGKASTVASGTYVVVFDGTTGAEKWKSQNLEQVDYSFDYVYDIELSDVDGDGNKEIIASLGGKALYVFDGTTKQLDWSSTYDAYALKAADVDDDGDMELIVGGSNGVVDILDGTSYSLKERYQLGSGVVTGISLSDLIGDSKQEWIICENDSLSVYDSAKFLLWRNKWLGNNLSYYNSICSKDIDGNGYKDLIFCSYYALYQFETYGKLGSFITSPANGVLLTGTEFAINGSAFTDSGAHVHQVEVSTDGGTTWSLATDTSDDGSWSSWSYYWSSVADGLYNIKSRITDDTAKQEIPSEGINITVDNTAPASNVTYPSSGTILSSILCEITGTANDNQCGISLVEVSTDNGLTWSPALDTSSDGSWSTWSYNWSSYSRGEYILKSRATDNANNLETPGPGITVTVPLHAPLILTLSPTAGIFSDDILNLYITMADDLPTYVVLKVRYDYSFDGSVWILAGQDYSPDDPFHWYSGLDDVDVYLRARAYDGIGWSEWYYNSGTIQIENTDPVLIGPDHGTLRGAAFSDPSGPLVLDWSPNNCSKFTVYFSAIPFGGKAVKVKSDNGGYDPTLTISLKNWLKITKLGREIWWWVTGTAPDGARLTSAANLLILEGGFSAITDLPATDLYAIPTLECDPGVNTVAGLQFSNEPYFLKPVKYPSRPVAVSGSLYSATPDVKSWSKITKLNHGVNWRFTGMLATGETTYSETNVLTITGGPAIDSHSDDDVVTSAPTITWTDGGGFTGYQVQASASDTFPEKKPFNLGSTGGEKSLTVSAGTWESLKLLGDPVYIRVMGTTADKYTAYSEPVRIYLNAP